MKISLKELRARHDLTQEKTAEIMGIARNTYFRWEKDIQHIPIGCLVKLLDYTNTDISEIKIK